MTKPTNWTENAKGKGKLFSFTKFKCKQNCKGYAVLYISEEDIYHETVKIVIRCSECATDNQRTVSFISTTEKDKVNKVIDDIIKEEIFKNFKLRK